MGSCHKTQSGPPMGTTQLETEGGEDGFRKELLQSSPRAADSSSQFPSHLSCTGNRCKPKMEDTLGPRRRSGGGGEREGGREAEKERENMCMCVHALMAWHSLWKLVLCFYHVDPGAQTQVVKLHGSCFYSLSHLAGPTLVFSKVRF